MPKEITKLNQTTTMSGISKFYSNHRKPAVYSQKRLNKQRPKINRQANSPTSVSNNSSIGSSSSSKSPMELDNDFRSTLSISEPVHLQFKTASHDITIDTFSNSLSSLSPHIYDILQT